MDIRRIRGGSYGGDLGPAVQPAVAWGLIAMALYLCGAGLGVLPKADRAQPHNLLGGGAVVLVVALALATARRGLRLDLDRHRGYRTLRVFGLRFERSRDLHRARAVLVEERPAGMFYLGGTYDRRYHDVAVVTGGSSTFTLCTFTTAREAEPVAAQVAELLGVPRERGRASRR